MENLHKLIVQTLQAAEQVVGDYQPDAELVAKYTDVNKLAKDIVEGLDTWFKIDRVYSELVNSDPNFVNRKEASEFIDSGKRLLKTLGILSKTAGYLIDQGVIKEEELFTKIAEEINEKITGINKNDFHEYVGLLEIKYNLAMASGVLYGLATLILADKLGKCVSTVAEIGNLIAKEAAKVAYIEGALDTFAFLVGQATAYASFIIDNGLDYITTDTDDAIKNALNQLTHLFAQSPLTKTYLQLQELQAGGK